MINYNISKKDLKTYIKEIGFSQSKIPFILSIISVPFAIYFMGIGVLVDSEALLFGYSLAFLTVFMTIVGIVNYYKLKKDIVNIFKSEEMIQYKLEFVEEQYTINNTMNQQIAFKSTDIANVLCKKNTIIVKLKNRKIVFFPNIDEIKAMLCRN